MTDHLRDNVIQRLLRTSTLYRSTAEMLADAALDEVYNDRDVAAALSLRAYLSEWQVEAPDVLHYLPDGRYDHRTDRAYNLLAMLRAKANLPSPAPGSLTGEQA